MAIYPIRIKTPAILEPKVLRSGEKEIQIELEVYANYQPDFIREEPVERVVYRVTHLETARVTANFQPMTQTPPPGLKWRGVFIFPYDQVDMDGLDTNGNYRIDFHAWDRGYEADTQDREMVGFDHANSTVTLNRDITINYGPGPYFPKWWSLDPEHLGRDDNTLQIQTQVTAGIWVAGYERINKVKASIYSWAPAHDPTMAPSFNRPPDLDQEYDLRLAKGTFHRGLWQGRIEFPSHFPNGTYSIAFSATSVSGLVVTTRNYPDIDSIARVIVTGR